MDQDQAYYKRVKKAVVPLPDSNPRKSHQRKESVNSGNMSGHGSENYMEPDVDSQPNLNQSRAAYRSYGMKQKLPMEGAASSVHEATKFGTGRNKLSEHSRTSSRG